MRFRIMVVFTAALLINAAILYAGNNSMVSVMPDKVLYAPGETAKFDITVDNETKESVKGVLEVKVIWEMDDTAIVKKENIEVSPGEKKTITAEWKTLDVLGCEVRADLMNGKDIIATAAEYFNVCPKKDVQRVGIHVEFPNLVTFSDKSFLATIPGAVAGLRLAYGNLVEHFAWAFDSYAGLAPKQDEWESMYWESKTAIRKAIEEEHKHGMKALSYAISTPISSPGEELMRRHPDWFFYREDGQFWGEGINVKKLDFYRHPDVRGADPFYGGALWTFLNFSLKGPLQLGIRQLIESKQMFNWDGVRFDGHFIMWTPACPGARDITGKPVAAGKEIDPINRANTDYTKRAISAVFPDYIFMFNSDVHESDIAEICRDGGATANEPVRESSGINSQWNDWKAFAQYLLDDVEIARRYGGYAYAYMNPPWEVCPNVDRIQYAILFAAGDHPWFSFPALDRKSDLGGSHYPIQKDYCRFATRFSAVLWGRGIERVISPEDVVDVSAPQGSVWWKEFVQRRPLADGRQELIVHLINQPSTPNIVAESQPLPAPVKNVTVKFKQPVKRVWLATSQPELSYQMLPVENGTVKVPGLNIWSIVIAETEGK